jgi:hypothetical protein
MIINPVMIRNVLNARGAHATIVSVMTVFLPVLAIRLVSRRDAGEKHLRTTKLRPLARPHRNKLAPKVFRDGDLVFAERIRAERPDAKGPGVDPGPG